MKSVFQRPLLFLPLFFLVLQSLTAQTAGEASSVRSLLWEIKGKGLAEPSYLYGTIHLIGKSDFFLTDATEKAFGETQRVAFEIDLEEMGDFSTLLPLLMQSFMKKDTTLRDLLLPEEYSAVKAHFEQLGLPMFFLDRIKPMFLTALDPQAMAQPGESEDETVSYEMEFLRMAQEADKPIDGLETAAFQMSMFDSIPYRVQARMLVDMVKGNQEVGGNQEFQQMVEMYKNQDIEGMQGMLGADKEIAAYENLLLINRNRKWIPVMEKMMTEKPTFFAVGAGHLGGKQGVVQLLRDSGYSITPLN